MTASRPSGVSGIAAGPPGTSRGCGGFAGDGSFTNSGAIFVAYPSLSVSYASSYIDVYFFYIGIRVFAGIAVRKAGG
jgi:hypothetical protein